MPNDLYKIETNVEVRDYVGVAIMIGKHTPLHVEVYKNDTTRGVPSDLTGAH